MRRWEILELTERELPARSNAPRVLLAHLSIGGGHARAAAAAKDALQRRAPRATIADLDIADVATPLFTAIYHDGYLSLVKSLPSLWGALYAAGWRAQRGTAVPQWLRPRCVGRLASVVDKFRPDVILATAAPAAALLAHLKETAITQARLVALITDYHAHPTHVQPAIDRYLAADTRVAAGLRKLGADRRKIAVTGIPVAAEFAPAADRAKLRRRLGLASDKPVVMVMGGALGSGSMLRIVRDLLLVEPRPQLVVIAGRNRSLEERLHQLRATSPCPLEIYGYTSLVPEMMAAADLLVTKPGGVSTTEALVCHLPMIFVDAIQGAESRNKEFFERAGCAIGADSRESLQEVVRELLRDPARLAGMRAAAQKRARPDAADAVASNVLDLAVSD
jgi:processive 1,2-diacylglycerol beta-glucosyltransferase